MLTNGKCSLQLKSHSCGEYGSKEIEAKMGVRYGRKIKHGWKAKKKKIILIKSSFN